MGIKNIVYTKEFLIPVVLLIIGSLLIPSIFAQIENRQKELEFKTDLIREMTTAMGFYSFNIFFLLSGGRSLVWFS